MKTDSHRRVVVTGMGVASPLGSSVAEFWRALLAGESGVRRVENMDLAKSRAKIGAQVKGYRPEDHFSPKELKRYSLATQLALVSAQQAVEQSGLENLNGDPLRHAVIMGTSNAGFTASESHFAEFYAGPAKGNPFIVSKVMNNAPASNISIKYGFQGPLMTTDAACASSAHAIGYAFQQIRAGLIDVAITGGADATLSPAVVQAWSLMRVLSERNDDPQRALRPFSKDREGMVLGEGAGLLVLESEEHARERGAEILAEVSGYGATSDGHHITQPSQDGPRAAIQLALEDARLKPEQIDYVNAHATATAWNDSNETTAIKLALGEHAYNIPVVGIKGAIGHPIAASGALEFVSVVKSIEESRVPPTINRLVPDPECDLDYVTDGPREVEIEHAVSNSFAFGGSNAVLVASRYNQSE